MTTTGTKERDATKDTPAVPEGMGAAGLGSQNAYLEGDSAGAVDSGSKESSLEASSPPASEQAAK